VGVPEADLGEGECLGAGSAFPLIAVVDASVHCGVALPVLSQDCLAGIPGPGGGAVLARDLPEVGGED